MTGNPASNMACRRGFSLLEVAVAVSILSIVLALAATTIVALFRVERQFAGDAKQESAIARFAAQFRADAHRAAAVQVDGECKLLLPGGSQVQYGVADSRLTRTVARDGQTEHRDSFLFEDRIAAKFVVVPDFENRLLRVQIAAAAAGQAPRPSRIRPIVIEAAVNLHSRTNGQEAPP